MTSTAPSTPTGRSPWIVVLVVLAVAFAFAAWRVVTPSSTADDVPASGTRAPTTADAIAQLRDRVSVSPDDLDAWQQLAIAYTRDAALTGDPALYAAAQDAVNRARALAPDSLGTQLAAGNLALSLHQFPDALAIAEASTTANPNSPEAHAVLVDALVEMGRYDEATEQAQRLLDLRPALPALARASYLRELSGDIVGATLAMQEAETAGAGAPLEAARVGVLLGNLARLGGDLDGARAAYERALRSSPGMSSAVVGRALARADGGDVEGAIDDLDQQATRTPSPDVLLAQLALQAAAGDDVGAAQTADLVRVVLQLLRDGDQVVDLEFALFEADHGDPDEAVRLARLAHEVRPGNIFVQDALGWALHRAGRSDEALEHSTAALRLGTVDPLLRWHAAEVLAANDLPEDARATLAEVGDWNDARTAPYVERLLTELDAS